MLSEELKREAAERGAEWGRQEAALMADAIENGHRKTWPEWTMGTYCGALPEGDDRDQYELLLDRAAKAAYDAAIAEVL
jgi:hypothetical protein